MRLVAALLVLAASALDAQTVAVAACDDGSGVCRVAVVDRQFEPRTQQIQVGQSVTWDLGSLRMHSVQESALPFSCVARPGPGITLNSSGSTVYTVTFTEAGEFSYFSPGEDCDVFGMFGHVLVSQDAIGSASASAGGTGAGWALAVLVVLPTVVLVAVSALVAGVHSSGSFKAVRLREVASKVEKAQAAGEKVWIDDKWGITSPTVDLPSHMAEDSDEIAVDEDRYNEFYGRLCVLRHDKNTFTAMLREMTKRLDADRDGATTHERYAPIVADLTRLLYLMKHKTAQGRSMPPDAAELLLWAHGTLEKYLEQQTRLAEQKISRKVETET